jgi:acyl-coenzyme A synthetase/AMP-(fatty) acid ligase
VLTMVACFRIGAVVLPCTEQLRAGDLRQRLETVRPKLIVADERNLPELEAAGPECPILTIPGPDLFAGPPQPAEELDPDAPALITFTSGTSGYPKAAVHAQRYLLGQSLQASSWLGVEAGDRVWCTAASGWSKSARNVFIAPWIGGGCALLHDARFDPAERLEIVGREGVDILCMAPTEYRVIAKRGELRALGGLRRLVAAGEALDEETLHAWRAATGLTILDGYGQTETGQLTGLPDQDLVRPGSMGLPLPGIRMWIEEGELVVDPSSVPTFFNGYLGEPIHDRSVPWRTGDQVRQDEDGYLYFESRADDVIISSGYRIGPFEVESALLTHPAVTEAAVVGAPDSERGSVVMAVVSLAPGSEGDAEMVRTLQDHVKSTTAPYKYPRIIEFADAIPKTASGKIRRALLRERAAGS